MRRSLTALACTAGLAALIGCGDGESDQEQGREVVEDYVEARNEGDFDRVCELFSEDFNRRVGNQFDLSDTADCAAGVQVASEASRLGAPGTLEFRVIDVRVHRGDHVPGPGFLRGRSLVTGPAGPELMTAREQEAAPRWRRRWTDRDDRCGVYPAASQRS